MNDPRADEIRRSYQETNQSLRRLPLMPGSVTDKLQVITKLYPVSPDIDERTLQYLNPDELHAAAAVLAAASRNLAAQASAIESSQRNGVEFVEES